MLMFSTHSFAESNAECSFNTVSSDDVNALITKYGIPFTQSQVRHADEVCYLLKKNNAVIYLKPYSGLVENQRFTGLYSQIIDADLIKKEILLTSGQYTNFLNVTELDNYEIKNINSVDRQGKQAQLTQTKYDSNKKMVLDQVSQAIMRLDKSDFDALNKMREKLRNFDRNAPVITAPKTKDCLIEAVVPNPKLLKGIEIYGFSFSKPKYEKVCEAYKVNNVQTVLLDSTVVKGGRLYTSVLMFNGLNEYLSKGIHVFTMKTVDNMSMSKPGPISDKLEIDLLYSNAMKGYENQNLDMQMREIQIVRQRLAQAK